MKTEMVVWKQFCQEKFRFDLQGQTFMFFRKKLTVKLMWNIFSETSF